MPAGKLTQEKIAELNLQLRTMELFFELVQIANEMVKRGEAATVVQGLGSIMGAVAAEREQIVETIREIKEAAE